VDNVAPEGVVGFYYSPRGGEAIYRWVKVESLDVPIVDFDGNGTVDMKDLLKMIGCWGQDEPAVDLSGNGTVDKEDLEILMDYWQQDVNDVTLLAHWALDEAQGDIAYDSVGIHDATLIGGPAWAPNGGQIDGALQLDGLDDCVVAPFVGNLGDGPFSVFAWVKGGAPGQVILSQAGGADWLAAEPGTGCLMTELQSGGRLAQALCSAAVITDGDWHRVGLVWDGANRALYVDDVLAAEDTQSSLADCLGGLCIGATNNLAAGSLFAGLIDDVRIYNRAVNP